MKGWKKPGLCPENTREIWEREGQGQIGVFGTLPWEWVERHQE